MRRVHHPARWTTATPERTSCRDGRSRSGARYCRSTVSFLRALTAPPSLTQLVTVDLGPADERDQRSPPHERVCTRATTPARQPPGEQAIVQLSCISSAEGVVQSCRGVTSRAWDHSGPKRPSSFSAQRQMERPAVFAAGPFNRWPSSRSIGRRGQRHQPRLAQTTHLRRSCSGLASRRHVQRDRRRASVLQGEPGKRVVRLFCREPPGRRVLALLLWR